MKRVLLTISCLLMVLVMLLSGCGRGPTQSKNTNTDVNQPSASEEGSESDPYFGRYKNPVVVNMAAFSRDDFPKGESPGNNVWTRSWQEDLNVKINILWEAPEADGSFETKMNLAIASNQLPDIMILTDYSQFDRLVNAGKLEDLTDYYEKYTYPFLKKVMNEDGGEALSWGKINGRLMGFPRDGINYQTTRMIYIRRDWFEKSGLPKPKSLEDVLNIAKAFRDQDPKNRFGLPLAKTVMMDGMCDIVGVANALGVYPRTWIEDESGKLVYGTIQPGMKKVLQIYANLYKEGYIDPAFASLDGVAVAEQLTSGKIGVIIGNFWLPTWPLNALWEQKGVEWDIYPLLKSEEFAGPLKVQTDAPGASMLAVRKGYEHPEVLFKLLNYTTAKIYDPERAETKKFHSNPDDPNSPGYFAFNPLSTMWGPRRTNFDSNPDVTNAIDKNDTSYLKTPHDQTQYKNVKKYFDAMAAGKRPDGAAWAAYKLFYGPNSTFGIQNYYFDNDSYLTTKLIGYQTPEMVRQWANLEKLEDQYATEIISGARPVDDFDKFVQDWKKLGGEVIEVEVNNWYKNKNKK